jgi:hypothetical protein
MRGPGAQRDVRVAYFVNLIAQNVCWKQVMYCCGWHRLRLHPLKVCCLLPVVLSRHRDPKLCIFGWLGYYLPRGSFGDAGCHEGARFRASVNAGGVLELRKRVSPGCCAGWRVV